MLSVIHWYKKLYRRMMIMKRNRQIKRTASLCMNRNPEKRPANMAEVTVRPMASAAEFMTIILLSATAVSLAAYIGIRLAAM